MPPETSVLLQLNRIDELFTAPSVNPFSTHEVDILGQSGLDCIQKRVTRHWPRRPRALRVTLQLPADQMTPDLAKHTRSAAQRYYAKHIDENHLQRRVTMQRARRQLAGAFVGILIALIFVAALVMNPWGLLPAFLRGVLLVLALYACSVLSFDAVWSVALDWIPFVQDNAVYRVMQAMDVVVESQPHVP